MNKKLIYIANWKTYLSHNQAIAWCRNNAQGLENLTTKADLIICPNFTALAQIQPFLDTTALGAQNCSAFEPGAHTGDVNAGSLKEVGVSYCIVGHSECRKQNNETPEMVAQKVIRLLEVGITPILCVSDEFKAELQPVLEMLKENTHLIIAYEPISAIGTGNTADNATIEAVIGSIKREFQTKAPTVSLSLVYGGSVSPESIQKLKTISCLDGFLIGKASTDFQKLKNIVEL